MTVEVKLYFIKNLHLDNVSIHRDFYQNQFLNEYARKKKAKISESRSPGITESRSFLVRYRRTYVLNKRRIAYAMIDTGPIRRIFIKGNIRENF